MVVQEDDVCGDGVKSTGSICLEGESAGLIGGSDWGEVAGRYFCLLCVHVCAET